MLRTDLALEHETQEFHGGAVGALLGPAGVRLVRRRPKMREAWPEWGADPRLLHLIRTALSEFADPQPPAIEL